MFTSDFNVEGFYKDLHGCIFRNASRIYIVDEGEHVTVVGDKKLLTWNPKIDNIEIF